jgi:hypothetical protein
MQTSLYLVDLKTYYNEIDPAAKKYLSDGSVDKLEGLLQKGLAQLTGERIDDVYLNQDDLPALIASLKSARTRSERVELVRIACAAACRALCLSSPRDQAVCDLDDSGLLGYLVDNSEWLRRCFAGAGEWGNGNLDFGFGITDELLAGDSVVRFQAELQRLPSSENSQIRDGLLRLRRLLERAQKNLNLKVDVVTF